jgi:alanine dehydrogenase
MVRILRDAELRALVDIPAVVARIEAGYRADARGEVVAFPRTRVDAQGVTLAWLGAGIPAEGLVGFRSYVYRSDGYDRGEQVVALYGYPTMELRALFVGRLIGNLRTGAAIAAALHLTEPGLPEIGLIGTGAQARNALACLAATLRPTRVVAWSPNRVRREEFRTWSRQVLGLQIDLVESASEVLREVSAVVCVTSSAEPVVTPNMLTGPKLLLSISSYRDPEIDLRILNAAPHIWTDSVEQASGPGTLFRTAGRRSKLRPLGQGIADGSARDRESTRIIINTGAAWEEVVLAEMLFELADAKGVGVHVPIPSESPGAAVF